MISDLPARLARMDTAEIRFRASSLWDQWIGRARVGVRPGWRRGSLLRRLSRPFVEQTAGLSDACRASQWAVAQQTLIRRFAARTSAFPLDPRDVPEVVAGIRAAWPDAPRHARDLASRVLEGRYDLLGYTGVQWGTPPDWHRDPIHDRRAPSAYWSDVPFLSPSIGDHKVIWELNRHQYWLALGRAFRLTGDGRFQQEFERQLESWLAANPPLVGINWASMLELALRSISWMWALTLFSVDPPDARPGASPWCVDLLIGIDEQLDHVERHLSRYFSPNTHLTGEALALYVGGLALPELAASARRVQTGRAILVDEAHRQIAPDGGHRELSGHYQRYSTDFYLLALLAARKSGDAAAATLEQAARSQARYLEAICDGRGRRPAIGDDDGGLLFPMCGRSADDCRDTLAIAALLFDDPSLAAGRVPEEAFWLGLNPPATLERDHRTLAPAASTVFADTGYCVSRATSGARLIFDAGPHGFLNGGHAHADALSIVLSVDGRPLLVDPGTATYTVDAATRDRFRATAMHNTMVVGGQPQSKPRGPFHWQHAANGALRLVRLGHGWDYFEATHDGYAPLVHTRAVLAVADLGWFVVDTISGEGSASGEMYWHLDPAWSIDRHGAPGVMVAHGERLVTIAATAPFDVLGPGDPDRLSEVSPCYGRIDESHTLRAAVRGPLPLSALTAIAPGQHLRPGVLREIAVDARCAGWTCRAFALEMADRTVTLLSGLETTGIAGADAAGPDDLWGCGAIRTDARIALYVEFEGGDSEAFLVNGRRLIVDGRPPAELPDRAPLLRTRLGPRLAHDVHQLAHQD